MTNNSFGNTTPNNGELGDSSGSELYRHEYAPPVVADGISGIIFALEGIHGSVVLLNGPTGCKFYHSSTSDGQVIRQPEFDPHRYPSTWYFGQPRVPCTYLDTRDYVYGSEEKLEEALHFLSEHVPHELLCVVNSPGAALIGDDLVGIVERYGSGVPYVIIETPGFSENICLGYGRALTELLRQVEIPAEQPVISGRVNILGLSIYHRNHEGDCDELRRLLALCGIEVNCFFGAECDFEDIMALPTAELNIVLYPEYGDGVAVELERHFGTPYISFPAPIGFAATEELVRAVCARLGTDTAAFEQESERSRARAFKHVSRVNSLTGMPKGVSFSAEGMYSELYALTAFLTRYYGLIPLSLRVAVPESDAYREEFLTLLDTLNIVDAAETDLESTQPELVFGTGNTIARLKQYGFEFCGIEISLPSLGYIDVLPKTILGLRGALHLTELILNALPF